MENIPCVTYLNLGVSRKPEDTTQGPQNTYARFRDRRSLVLFPSIHAVSVLSGKPRSIRIGYLNDKLPQQRHTFRPQSSGLHT